MLSTPKVTEGLDSILLSRLCPKERKSKVKYNKKYIRNTYTKSEGKVNADG